MTQKYLLTAFSILILFSGNFELAHSQMLENQDYTIKLGITPNHVESGDFDHGIGYVYLLNKNGANVNPLQDVEIFLSSDNQKIASVPKSIIIHSYENFAVFSISTSDVVGETTITATLQNKSDFEKIFVGVDKSYLPDELILELNLPSDEMHVNSEMPFTVFLKTIDGTIVRAPYDIPIVLDHEDSLLHLDNDKLIIKQGEYYAWGIITSKEHVGNAFLRAIQPEISLDTAKSIKISSSLPSGLQIHVFPKVIPAEVDRTLDIFVSLVDSDGNPTIATSDVNLKLFSSDQKWIGEKLDQIMKDSKVIIKKGEFGYHLKQKFSLKNLLANDIQIGATSDGLGVTVDTFSTVGQIITEENSKVKEKQVKLFGLEKIPANSTAPIVYQLNAIEDDSDDVIDESAEVTDNPEKENESKIINSIDDLDDGELYPLSVNSNYRSSGSIQMITAVSGDTDLIKIKEAGSIESSTSYGTSLITSGQKSGKVLLSTAIKGVGSDSILVEIVNTLAQKEIRLFSPTGENNILFDRNGSFDIFVLAIDEKNRPKTMKEDTKYLISPTNELLTLKKGTTFGFANLQSDTFSAESEQTITLNIIPIGVGADSTLQNSKTFETQPSSKILVWFPNSELNVNSAKNIGFVQLVDSQNNPIIPTTPLKTKITSSNIGIVQTNSDVVIESGHSYAEFPIETTGKLGTAIISASAKGVVGSESSIKTTSSLTKLKIYSGGIDDKIPLDTEIPIKVYVDDENAESVKGAMITIQGDGNSTIIPNEVRTTDDGSATFNIKAQSGKQISLDLIATAEGYVDGKNTITINVDSPATNSAIFDLDLPEWIVYVVGIALALVGVLVILFLRKSKETIDEEYEEDEI